MLKSLFLLRPHFGGVRIPRRDPNKVSAVANGAHRLNRIRGGLSEFQLQSLASDGGFPSEIPTAGRASEIDLKHYLAS